MDDKNINTKEKILGATIKLYGTKGDITVREICNKAEVNLASISYHFGSKENLLIEVEKHYSRLLFNIQNEIIIDGTRDSRQKLKDWANTLMIFILEYPALIMLVTNLLIQDEGYNPEIIINLLANMELKKSIQDIITSLIDIEDEEILNFKYMQLFSGVMGPIIFQMLSNIQDTNRPFVDLKDEGERKRYIENLVDTVLTE